MKRIDVIGQRFGLLTVIDDMEERDKFGHRKVIAKCDCGNTISVMLGSIKSGETKSCGCERSRIMKEKMTTHGLHSHPIYKVWVNMRNRCNNPKDKFFSDYGGRGIRVCEEWESSFKVFYDFCIKSGWKPGLVIDRENNDKGYNHLNCRFVTQQINALNKRHLQSSNTSGFRGVQKRKKDFLARVRSISFKTFSKGGFKTAIEAAHARDKYCRDNNIPVSMNFPTIEERA